MINGAMFLISRCVILLCLLVLPSACNFLFKRHVMIINDLEEKLDLILHCKSGDDDLGEHLIHYDSTFEWSFRPNIFRTTLFYCSFQWKELPFKVWFDIYKYKIDQDCIQCNWIIKKKTDHVLSRMNMLIVLRNVINGSNYKIKCHMSKECNVLILIYCKEMF